MKGKAKEKAKEKHAPTIGQRLVAAVISHQSGIGMDQALKAHVLGLDINPSWEDIGQALLCALEDGFQSPEKQFENLGREPGAHESRKLQ